MKTFKILSNVEIELQQEQQMLDKIGDLTSYYRERPHEFAKDYLNISLRPFQKIVLYAMFHYGTFCMIACRGLGKSFLIAVYAVIKCILYPGSQICVTSVRLKQATEVLKKISNILCVSNGWGSELLNLEIKHIHFNGQDPTIAFNNGSFIYAVAANQNARSKRSTDNIYDEYVQMNSDIIRDILRPFLNVKRQVGFTNTISYNDRFDLVEENKEFYLSSAWYRGEWSFNVVKNCLVNSLVNGSNFTCALPYQLSIESGLLSPSRIKSEFDSPDYNPIKFDMEYGAIWYGSNGTELFTYEEIKPRRTLYNTFFSTDILFNKKSKIKISDLKHNQLRILSVDVALMAGKNNDAAVLIVNEANLNSRNEYVANIKYVEAFEGLRTEELGISIMRLYYKLRCNVLVVDARGNGQGVLDFVTMPQEDSLLGLSYLPFKAVNNEKWAERSVGKDFIETLWVINATSELNDEAIVRVKNVIDNNKIQLPVSEFECEEYLSKNIDGYLNKKDRDQLMYRKIYLETTLLINEMINLESEVRGKYLVISEKSGMRKDRYSSLAYNIWVMKELEKKIKPRDNDEKRSIVFRARKPNYTSDW